MVVSPRRLSKTAGDGDGRSGAASRRDAGCHQAKTEQND
jgi:hypothetical protein